MTAEFAPPVPALVSPSGRPALPRRWGALITVLGLLAALASGAESPAAKQSRIDALTTELERTRAQGQRWERLIATQRELAQHPDKFAYAAQEAARDLKGNGRELVFEGLSGGLSNFLKLNSAYTKSKKVKEGLELAASNIEEFYTLAIKDHVKAEDPDQWKPSNQVTESIEKSHAALNFLVVDGLPKGPVRDGIKGAMDISKGTLSFVTAYVQGDEPKMSANLGSLQSLLAGMKDVLPLLTESPAGKSAAELEGLLAVIAERNPAFGAVAKMMGTTALTDVNLALAIANFTWGSYALTRGFALQAEADEIRENQAEASLKLSRLLPRAQRELARAQAEEHRLEAALDLLTGGAGPSRIVQPSDRFIDDGARLPVQPASLPDTLSAIQRIPPLQLALTADAIEQSLTDFRNTTEREREEKRQQLAAEKAARERARRAAEEQRRWAREREREERAAASRRSSSSSSSSSGSSRGSSSGSSSGSYSGSSAPTHIPNVGTSFGGGRGETLFGR